MNEKDREAVVVRRANALVNTSVDDARSSLYHESDLDVLRAALIESLSRGEKTRPKHISSRIRALVKARRFQR